MLAKIYQPARSAMTSGQANTKSWVLEYAPESRRTIDPLMGWTSSDDMNGQVKLRFDSREAAVEYAERHRIAFQVLEPKKRRPTIRPRGYGDNFATERRAPWTH
ncbi:ETC complex I subunit [Rubrimonas cliftonensis]|uniref:NADH dehydrogenase n=1 Tax=Rubrimonas cliftonensis TaxID=89524 RepID=A0A1H3WRZ1_9RHOB|nr:ETC complex I subunit [Rubrimonas cliftonensis]SDZ89899.1 NADH dehydrogenase [Rubrimonas cliftonensis]